MKTRHAVAALIALTTLAGANGWAQTKQPAPTPPPPAGTSVIPEKTAPTPPAGQDRRDKQDTREKQDKPGKHDPQNPPATDPVRRSPAPSGGEGGTDSRGPSPGKGGTGSTGQGGMPGSGASAGSGGSADTR